MDPVIMFPLDPKIFLQQFRDIIKEEINGMQKLIPTKGMVTEEINTDIIRIGEAQKITGYGKKYLYKLIGSKSVPHLKIGKGAIRFSRKELQAWMHAGRPSIHQEAIDSLATNYLVNGKN